MVDGKGDLCSIVLVGEELCSISTTCIVWYMPRSQVLPPRAINSRMTFDLLEKCGGRAWYILSREQRQMTSRWTSLYVKWTSLYVSASLAYVEAAGSLLDPVKTAYQCADVTKPFEITKDPAKVGNGRPQLSGGYWLPPYYCTTFYNFHGRFLLSGVALRYVELFCSLMG